MCLAVPRKVEKVNGKRALMQDGREVDLTLVGKVKKGDMLIVSANMAVDKLSPKATRLMKKVMGVK